MPPVEPGRRPPAFSLSDQTGVTHAMKDYLGAPVVLYFYPKDDTPGCTKQACAFNDLLPVFAPRGVAVLGVSPDSAESHARFAAKYNLNITLLADPGAGVCAKFGVWREKSMYGRTYMGVVRTTYLIDAAGKVAQRWDKVKVPGHAEAVLAALAELE